MLKFSFLLRSKQNSYFFFGCFFIITIIVLNGCTPPKESGSSVSEDNIGEMSFGNPELAKEEVECAKEKISAPWYGTLVPGFNHDAERTSTFGCARFDGSMTEPNVVEVVKTSPGYATQFTTVSREPEDVYWYAGCAGDAVPPQLQTYIAKVEPVTMKEIWRTNLSDARENNQLHACGSQYMMADGNIIAVSDHTLYKLDGDDGEIVNQMNYPTGQADPNDAVANGFSFFPDGTIIVKTINQMADCELNGFFSTLGCPGAINPGPPPSMNSAPSVLSAINPDTFEVLAELALDENYISRVSTTVFEGHEYIYLLNLAGQLLRWEWDGKEIKRDEEFGAPNSLLVPGQTGGGAPTVLNDWVIVSTSGLPSSTTMSIVAIHQADPTRIESINLTPNMQSDQISFTAVKPSVDPDNNRIYVADYGVGIISAIQMDDDGKLSMLWQAEKRTDNFSSLIGTSDQRVFVTTNMKADFPITNPLEQLVAGPEGANYSEQFVWFNAETGKILAESDFYSPVSLGSHIAPGYGGIMYGLLNNGDVAAMHVRPVN